MGDASSPAGPGRARRWAALALLALAAGAIVWPRAANLADPAWPEPDEFQAHLDGWSRVLAPVEEHVPAGEALAYACMVDGEGRPLADLDRWFDVFQAVLAPRRIARGLDSRWVLVHFETREGAEQPAFDRARVLAELAQGLVLVERTAP
jgi:hypothetical protein